MSLWWILLCGASAHAAKSEKLWNEWYLVTRNGAPVSLFEETAEKRGQENEIAITQNWIENAGDRQETYIGSVSNAETLAPVAFFVERKGGKPYKTDARVKGQQLEITFKPGSPDLAKSTELTPLGKGYYLSSILPTAIARKFVGKAKESFAFTAVVEDGGDMNVEVKKGTVDVGTKEKKIGKENCREALVVFDGKSQEWWVTKAGKACLVVFPDSGTKMELSTEKAAKKAMKEAT
jgi:hypothetical protein